MDKQQRMEFGKKSAMGLGSGYGMSPTTAVAKGVDIMRSTSLEQFAEKTTYETQMYDRALKNYQT